MLVDCFPCCLFFGTPRLSSIRAGDQSLIRRVPSLWAEVLPADTQRIEGLNGQVVSAARFAPRVQLPLMSARLTGKDFITSLCRDDTKFSEMPPHLNECVRTAEDFSKDVVDVLSMKGLTAPFHVLSPTPCLI